MSAANHTTSPKEVTLFFITNHFPYGKGETFVENEVPYLVKAFKKVIVLSRDKNPALTRNTQGFTHYRSSAQSSPREKLAVALYILSRLGLYRKLLRQEKTWLQQRGMALTPDRSKQLRHDLVKAFNTAMVTERLIRQTNITGPLMLYSYWLQSAALGISLVRYNKGPVKTIARGHGGDIHEFRHATQYLSFRNIMAQRLDKVVISAPAGRAHYIKFVDAGLHKKVEVSHLGTNHNGAQPAKTGKGFTVLSCANIVEVKRIDILVRALAVIDDLPIHWVHIGEGHLRSSLEKMATELLGPKNNITYAFAGQKKYAEVMEFYRTHYVDLFVNTSSSEATPVSIMEANSFGVPAIGFDVGGIGDIVSDKTGKLLPANGHVPELANAIRQLLGLPAAEMERLRQSTHHNWETYYRADVAYNRFTGILASAWQ